MSKTIIQPGQGGLALSGGSWFPPAFKKAGWRPPRIADLPSLKGVKRLGLDTETKDSSLRELGPGVRRIGNYVVGYSFAIEGGPMHYLPTRHEGGDNMEEGPERVRGWLTDQFKEFDGDVVGANLPYDLDWMWSEGILMPKVRRFYDVQVADPLIYELEDYYSLEAIATRRGFMGKDEEMLREAARQMKLDPKKDLWRMPARFVGEYAEVDALRPLQILRSQEEDIARDGIEACWDMESRLLPVLVRMTQRGVPVDEDRLARIEEWTKQRELEQYAIVKEQTGVNIPLGHSMDVDLLGRALKAVGLEELIGTTSQGKDSVTKELLGGSKHPVAVAIGKARQVATLRTTFVNGTKDHIVNGRIHCSFNQIRKTDDNTGDSSGVAYGRLSASHVNMQNQPGNSRFSGDNEVGPMWRSIYGNVPGKFWCANDLKQQEPKWSFHFGAMMEEKGVEGVRGALAVCQQLNDDPSMDTYMPIVKVAKVRRPTAKIMWLARTYGQGDGTLCANLHLPTCQVTFSNRLFRAALDEGKNKYEAKRLAVVPVDSEEGQYAKSKGSFDWVGAGPEGKVIIDTFDNEMPFLKVCADIAKAKANENGYVKLISGRRCHFERGPDGKYGFTHKAFNRVVQGSAAEQTKEIMLAVAAESQFDDVMVLQVHDELDFLLDDPKMGKDIAEVMRTAVPMKVPTVVDTEIGPSWGESMGVEFKGADGKDQKVQYRWGMKTEDGKDPVLRGDIL